MLARKALAGTAGAAKEYVEDVFQTWLYTGTNDTQTIANGIDVSGDGGLVWIKSRSTTWDHCLFDTARGGVGKAIFSNSTAAEATGYTTTFLSNGFSVGNANAVNQSDQTYASWTFRKAKKFFDVVTYTGNGSAPRDISHNLGSSPGFIIIKRTNSTGDWWCWHRSIANKNIYLNYTDAADSGANPMISAVSSTNFTLATNQNATMNINGATYVAYLFAHDAGGFGDAGSDSIIKCGSYTGTGSNATVIDLGWEPQWLLVKNADAAANWVLIDNMRGVTTGGVDTYLRPNTTNADDSTYDLFDFHATGFEPRGAFGICNAANKYIYIAIRRGPMKTPTSGTSVFAPSSAFEPSSTALFTGGSFPPDLVIHRPRVTETWGQFFIDRLRGGTRNLSSTSTSAEPFDGSLVWNFDSNTGAYIAGGGSAYLNNAGGTSTSYSIKAFRRAPGFFDVVCYTGTGSATTQTHNLGVAPELIIVKRRSSTGSWLTYSATLGIDKYLTVETTDGSSTATGIWGANAPTSTVFSLPASYANNSNGSTYVAYLFASVSGVSKVGSYTGNGSSVTVTTDFQPRFIMVKRTDSTGNWIVSDSARGLVAGNDPYLELNTTDAEVTNEDWVDISSTSFTVNQTTNNANVNTGTYIYLCIA